MDRKELVVQPLQKLRKWCEDSHGTRVSEILVRLNDGDERWIDVNSKFSIEMFKEWIKEQ